MFARPGSFRGRPNALVSFQLLSAIYFLRSCLPERRLFYLYAHATHLHASREYLRADILQRIVDVREDILLRFRAGGAVLKGIHITAIESLQEELARWIN